MNSCTRRLLAAATLRLSSDRTRSLCLVGCLALAAAMVAGCRRVRPAADSPMPGLEQAYLTRLETGETTPFRLAETALRDPRLGDEAARVAQMLLRATAEGRAYRIDPAALDAVSPDSARRCGAGHAALIVRAFAATDRPRVAELAIRLAYGLAAAHRDIRPRALYLVVSYASTQRDRVLARADALDLLRRARRHLEAPETLLVELRASHRLASEAPVLLDLQQAEQAEAIALGLKLAPQIRDVPCAVVARDTFRHRLPDLRAWAAMEGPHADAGDILTWSVERGARTTLEGLGANVAQYARAWKSGSGIPEFFAVAGRLLAETVPAARAPVARLELWAAVANRAHGQDPVHVRPASDTLRTPVPAALGAAAVEDLTGTGLIERSERAARISRAVDDFRAVFHAAELSGVRFRFGAAADRRVPDALAFHSASSHVITLRDEPAFGTLAHEFTHEIDAQIANHVEGGNGYATDLAAAGRSFGRLTNALRAIRAAPSDTMPLYAWSPSGPGPDRGRPAEVLARSGEWITAALLAERGRLNGDLFSVQDRVLTGYSSALTPDAAAVEIAATTRVFQKAGLLDDENAADLVAQFGPLGLPDALSVLRRVTDGAAAGADPDVAAARVHAQVARWAQAPLLVEVRRPFRSALDSLIDRVAGALAPPQSIVRAPRVCLARPAPSPFRVSTLVPPAVRCPDERQPARQE